MSLPAKSGYQPSRRRYVSLRHALAFLIRRRRVAAHFFQRLVSSDRADLRCASARLGESPRRRLPQAMSAKGLQARRIARVSKPITEAGGREGATPRRQDESKMIGVGARVDFGAQLGVHRNDKARTGLVLDNADRIAAYVLTTHTAPTPESAPTHNAAHSDNVGSAAL